MWQAIEHVRARKLKPGLPYGRGFEQIMQRGRFRIASRIRRS
jgi:hypothetical protein